MLAQQELTHLIKFQAPGEGFEEKDKKKIAYTFNIRLRQEDVKFKTRLDNTVRSYLYTRTAAFPK